jgi:hypothetical protein
MSSKSLCASLLLHFRLRIERQHVGRAARCLPPHQCHVKHPSIHLCFVVPVHVSAGSAGVSSGSLRALLSDKQVRHDLLLAAYQAGGVLQQLPAQQSRCVFEHAEMLAAVAAVLEWQRQQEAAAGDAQSGGKDPDMLGLLASVLCACVLCL